MIKAYKVQLKTNNKITTAFRRCAGIARYVYNWALAESKRRYDEGNRTGILKLNTEFNALKDELCPFVRDVPYAITESAFRNLDAAYKNFFRHVKKGEKPGFPKFKSKFGRTSFQLRGVKVFPEHVYLPKIGIVRLKQVNHIPVDAHKYGTYATISRTADKWFISVLVDDGIEAPEVQPGKPIGVDVGIKTLATFSDGKKIENPRPLDRHSKKLARLQRELSRREKDGKNYGKTKAKIARLHAKIANIRTHAQHQASNYAIEHGQTIVVESLNVRGMMSNHHLAKAVGDSAMSELLRQIKYKAAWNGKEIIEVSQWYPSSKTCSACGAKNEALTLADREFICPECGIKLDRDYNAACNLAALANRQLDGDCLGS